MTSEQLLVDAALRSWKQNVENVDKIFSPLQDEQFEKTIAPERNRLIYLLGHIAAVHDRMLPLLGAGTRLHPELDETFLTNADTHAPTAFKAGDLKAMLNEINNTLWNAFTKWSPAEWLSKHSAVSDEDFAREPHRNRYSVLLSRTTHLASHYGQLSLAKSRE